MDPPAGNSNHRKPGACPLQPSGNPGRIEPPDGSINPDHPGFLRRPEPSGTPSPVPNLPAIPHQPAEPLITSRPTIVFATWTDQFKPPRLTSQQDTPKPRPRAPSPPSSRRLTPKPRTALGLSTQAGSSDHPQSAHGSYRTTKRSNAKLAPQNRADRQTTSPISALTPPRGAWLPPQSAQGLSTIRDPRTAPTEQPNAQPTNWPPKHSPIRSPTEL
jgi:hypothetical protein